MNNKLEYFAYFRVEYIRKISVLSCRDFKEIEIFATSLRSEIFSCVISLYTNASSGQIKALFRFVRE